MLFTDLSDEEFIKIANSHVEALNYALSDVPAEKVRIHICWGNYEGPHVCDIPMAKMFDTLMAAKARYVLFETSNPRHGHEWTVFQDRKADIPDDKVWCPALSIQQQILLNTLIWWHKDCSALLILPALSGWLPVPIAGLVPLLDTGPSIPILPTLNWHR